jgi:hypothetical protein
MNSRKNSKYGNGKDVEVVIAYFVVTNNCLNGLRKSTRKLHLG